MREEEAFVIGQSIQKHCLIEPPQFLLNLGSGNVSRLLEKKPWIQQFILKPVEAVGCRIVHIDLKPMPGVDKTVDLTNRLSVADLSADFSSPRLIMLCNVLEHIPTKLVDQVVQGVVSLVRPTDHLVVSVPKKYPFHPDPIDTLFRPSVKEIVGLFPGLNVVDSGVVKSGSYWEEVVNMSPLKRLRRLLRPILPVSSLSRYMSDIHRLTFLWRQYEIAYVIFRGSEIIPPPRQISPS